MMTFRRHLRRQAKLSGENPRGLLVKTALSVFRTRNEYERFLRAAGIVEEERFNALDAVSALRSRVDYEEFSLRREAVEASAGRRFDALSAIATLRSKTNTASPREFVSSLASYFKLTNLVEADRLSRISYSTKYRNYLSIEDRDIAFAGYEWASPDDIDAVFRLAIRGTPAEYIRDLRLYEIEEGVNDTEGLLNADLAYRGGVPAELYRKLRGHVNIYEILAVQEASVPAEFAASALLSGATSTQTITAHRESIPLEYTTAL